MRDHLTLGDPVPTTSLPELLGAFSHALDLTEGQPVGHARRCAAIAGRMARALGLGARERRSLHYAVLLKDLGCSSNAARISDLYAADDRSFKADWKVVPEGLPSTLRFVFAATGKGQSLRVRIAKIANILKNGEDIAQEMILTRCTRGADIARTLRFDEEVARAIFHLDEHWDGSGRPDRLGGEAIPFASRIALLCQIADVFHTHGGSEAARSEVARRAGSWLDPVLAGCFASLAGERGFWAGIEAEADGPGELALLETGADMMVDEDFLDDIAAAFGAVVDAKSPYTSGHSGRVADYAARMGADLGLEPGRRRWLHRAALLHDIGKLAVSSRVLEKPGALGEDEWVEMRDHAAHTRSILGRIGCMADMAGVAAAHHEKLDGTGYPLGLKEGQIARETRIITACDFYDALTADRPYRKAMPVERALEIIGGEVGKAIDRDCFAALERAVAGGAPASPLACVIA